LGIRTNPGRYAYDFVPVNVTGAMGNGDNAQNANWIGFGMAIHAPAAGRVCAAHDGVADDRTYDGDTYPEHPNGVFGNYVIIDHGNGEFSQLGHMQRGSVRVRAGEQIEPGQVIGAVGASGSALFPHLHYQLTSSCDQNGEGLPSRFSRFERIQGARRVSVETGGIDTGEFVRAR
jgi:murein DD-endopeptidase MepM/ murein hydrolase activator NlpD